MNHWIESSDKDFDAVDVLYYGKQYSHSLFFGHLALEKLFKAIYAKSNQLKPEAPKIHNLVRLSELCHIKLDNEMIEHLLLINTFNMEARYEHIKTDFNKLCTREFTLTQINLIKEIRKWLKEVLIRK